MKREAAGLLLYTSLSGTLPIQRRTKRKEVTNFHARKGVRNQFYLEASTQFENKSVMTLSKQLDGIQSYLRGPERVVHALI